MKPSFIYGTAWKEDETERLVLLALEAGFRAIDTANQRKHYFEAGVGAALRKRALPRAELWLQTKFTFRDGQDHRLPYDPKAPAATQVRQSFESSLEHLGVDHLDSYVLHGPATRSGWSDADREVWSAMEALHASGSAKALGVSNVSLDQLEVLCAEAHVKPAYVQNRCYARTGWDQAIRSFCASRGITYQGFSLLTANPHVEVKGPSTLTWAQRVFRTCIRELGILPLTGTTDPKHMLEDLAVLSL